MGHAGRRAGLDFTAGQQFESFLADRKTRNAVERNLEIIGEAAGRASVAFREAHPVIPWKAIIGLRNALIHEYGEIRFEILWSVVQQKLPELIQELQAMNIDLTRAEED